MSKQRGGRDGSNPSGRARNDEGQSKPCAWGPRDPQLRGSPSTLVTIEIRPVEEGAEVVLTYSGFRDGEDASGRAEGWTETLEKLGKLLDREKDRVGTPQRGD